MTSTRVRKRPCGSWSSSREGRRSGYGRWPDHLLREAEADGRELPDDRRRDLQAVARDGQHAKDHMIRANLRLVVAIARKRYGRRGLQFLDVL